MAGQAYAWHEASIRIAGKSYPCRAMSQTITRESENIHVNSVEPTEFSSGPKNYEGSLTLLQSALEELEADFPAANDLTDIVFDVVVTFSRGDFIVSRLWKQCSITEIPMEHGQDTPFMEVELPLRISRIERI